MSRTLLITSKDMLYGRKGQLIYNRTVSRTRITEYNKYWHTDFLCRKKTTIFDLSCGKSNFLKANAFLKRWCCFVRHFMTEYVQIYYRTIFILSANKLIVNCFYTELLLLDTYIYVKTNFLYIIEF